MIARPPWVKSLSVPFTVQVLNPDRTTRPTYAEVVAEISLWRVRVSAAAAFVSIGAKGLGITRASGSRAAASTEGGA